MFENIDFKVNVVMDSVIFNIINMSANTWLKITFSLSNVLEIL